MTPVVKIDNLSDPFATVVTVEYGEKLGELLETVSGGACKHRVFLADLRSSCAC